MTSGSPSPVEPGTIGVLCLDTAFDKIPGHIRNTATFDFPVRYAVVKGATPERLIVSRDETLLAPFIATARDLEQAGVAAITGACGFLVLFQRQLADAVNVPVFTSSLILIPAVGRMLKRGQKVGVLTARRQSLTERHLQAVGATMDDIRIAGMEDAPEFREVILEGRRSRLDVACLRAEVLSVVDDMRQTHDDIGALIIECTDLPPFAKEIQEVMGCPVFDITTLTGMMHAAAARGG